MSLRRRVGRRLSTRVRKLERALDRRVGDLGLDYRPTVVHKGARRAAAAQVDARFEHLSLYDVRAALALAGKLACGPPPTLYARNLVEALRPVGRSNLWLGRSTHGAGL